MAYRERIDGVTDDASLDDVLAARDVEPISWVNIYGVHEPDVIQAIGTHYGLHPLVQEDIAHVGQRPKAEVFDDHVYIVLKMIYLRDDDGSPQCASAP